MGNTSHRMLTRGAYTMAPGQSTVLLADALQKHVPRIMGATSLIILSVQGGVSEPNAFFVFLSVLHG